MSASTAINEVTLSLKNLLRNEQTLDKKFDVKTDFPADETINDGTLKINLYLFRIEENSFAKNRDWQAVSNETLHKIPLSLNLFYVLTPYAKEQEDGHLILGEAMRILYDNAILEPFRLNGS